MPDKVFPNVVFSLKNSYIILSTCKKLTTTRREYMSNAVFLSKELWKYELYCRRTSMRSCAVSQFVLRENKPARESNCFSQIGQTPRAHARALKTSKCPSERLKGQPGSRRTSPEFVIFPRGKFVKATLMPHALQYHWNNRNVVDEALRGVLNSRTRARLITKELYRTWAKSVGEVKQTDGLLISSWWTFARALPRLRNYRELCPSGSLTRARSRN